MLSKLSTLCVVAAIASVGICSVEARGKSHLRNTNTINSQSEDRIFGGVVAEADDFDFSKASLSDIQDYLIAMLGDECTNAVKNGVTKELFQCMMSMEDDDDSGDDDDGFTEDDLKEMCDNKCMGTIFKAANAFFDDDECTNTAGLAGFGFDVDFIEQQQTYLGALCAKSNGMYCGLLGEIVGQAVETQTISKSDCQTIVDAGYCLGSLAAAFDSASEFFGDEFSGMNSTMVVDGLNAECTAVGVTGISEAASSTEASGVSAAATTAAGAFAAVAMVAAALVF